MKLTTLPDVLNCCTGEGEEITLSEEVRLAAKQCIDRMIEEPTFGMNEKECVGIQFAHACNILRRRADVGRTSALNEMKLFFGQFALDISPEIDVATAENVVMCGVRFMAETVKILSPEKKVYLSHAEAGCPRSDDKLGCRRLFCVVHNTARRTDVVRFLHHFEPTLFRIRCFFGWIH